VTRIDVRPGPLALAILPLVLGCAASTQAGERRADGGSGGAVLAQADLRTLSAAAPTGAEIVLPPVDDASHLEIDVVSVTKGDSTPVSLVASLTWGTDDASAHEAAIAPVTPYPAGTTGAFVVAVPAVAARALAGKASSARVRLTLSPVGPATSLPAAIQVVATARWPAR
jgi:hypothetical protein